jgi:hypothetical protein
LSSVDRLFIGGGGIFFSREQAAAETGDEGDDDGGQDDSGVVGHIVPDTADDVGVDVDPDRDGLSLEGLFAVCNLIEIL